MQYSEMQAGDKVEITDKRTVTISKVDENENAYDDDGRIIYASPDNRGISLGSYGSREFGLIERPIPDLPTKLGSIISVTHPNPDIGTEEYVLVVGLGLSYGVWRSINKSGATNANDMAQKVKAAGGFEVIR